MFGPRRRRSNYPLHQEEYRQIPVKKPALKKNFANSQLCPPKIHYAGEKAAPKILCTPKIHYARQKLYAVKCLKNTLTY